MRTGSEMELIQEKAQELAKLLDKEGAVNLRHDPIVKGVIELLLDGLDIPNKHKVLYLYNVMGRYV